MLFIPSSRAQESCFDHASTAADLKRCELLMESFDKWVPWHCSLRAAETYLRDVVYRLPRPKSDLQALVSPGAVALSGYPSLPYGQLGKTPRTASMWFMRVRYPAI